MNSADFEHLTATWMPVSSTGAESLRLAREALEGNSDGSFAAVRSARRATVLNPSGLSSWTRGVKVSQTLGPFKDPAGVTHFVDIFRFTVSTEFAFSAAANLFGVFPISRFLIAPVSPTELSLGAGSVWFDARLLAGVFASGSFTGFSITGGTLVSSAPLQLQGTVYVIPPGASITVTATLAGLPSPVNTGVPGADAAAAVFQPPASVKLVFTQAGVTIESITDASAEAYGWNVALHPNGGAPFLSPLTQVVIPCNASPASFDFGAASSELFQPSGSASIIKAGWAWPLLTTPITNLPETAGPGFGFFELTGGAVLAEKLETDPVPVGAALLEIGTGEIYMLAEGKAPPIKNTFELWPEAPPSTRNSSVVFSTNPTFIAGFISSAVEEIFVTSGTAMAHLSMPVSAAGSRFPYSSSAQLWIAQTKAATSIVISATEPDSPNKLYSIALENALVGVDAPEALIVTGALQVDNFISPCTASFEFALRWLLPTLPDPYAASFDLTTIERGRGNITGTLIATTTWTGDSAVPRLAFAIQSAAGAQNPGILTSNADVQEGNNYTLALLDLSTRVDLFGVASTPYFERLLEVSTEGSAPSFGFSGLTLAVNGAIAATFAVPQVSWEPMESTAVDQTGPILCEPAYDGAPLLAAVPNAQQLVPFLPSAVLVNNIKNVAAGLSFGATFSLPFGLNATIRQVNRPGRLRKKSLFLSEGGEYRTNVPEFPSSLTGALQLTLKPPFPDRQDAGFSGWTTLETVHGPAPGYGYAVLGNSAESDVGMLFEGEFSPGGTQAEVPVRRIDFSGYGASIFSEWNQPDNPVGIIKVQLDTTIGRTGYEVIKAASVIYPYCIRTVRTITIQRQNAGWISRADSGWQAASQGLFQFPPDIAAQWTNRVHTGAVEGVYNVRNIRDQPDIITLPSSPFTFRKVLFDADLGVNPNITVSSGGFAGVVPGIANPPVLVASRDLVGYLQLKPEGPPPQSPDPPTIAALFAIVGPLFPTVSFTVEAGAFGGQAGTTMRCSAFEVDSITEPSTSPNVPGIGCALRGAVQIPRGGGWSLGQRMYNQSAPAALPNDFPVPLIQPVSNTSYWFLADIRDTLQLNQPDNFYSLLHTTGTHKVLFESPQIPVSATITPPPPGPGLQFPKPAPPGPPKPGAVPVNPGSPNLGDLASILNSTGLFPDISSALSLLQSAIEQIATIPQGFQYSKSYTFDPNQQATLVDLDKVFNVSLQYADTTANPINPAVLTYSVDSSASPSWRLSVGPLSFLVTLPMFSSDPMLTITGGFYADEHTKPGVTNLNIVFGDALSIVKNVFSDLQALAQFLPGGIGAGLDVALSDGKLTVSDTFSISDLPLGLGNLTDVSLNLGLAVTLQPLSVNFLVGLGTPDNPFNWIVSPLAGNGLMNLGLENSRPALVIQAGIGLGLAIDLGIASGSASVAIAFQLNATTASITLMAILTGQASVSVLEGLASASLNLSAAVGFSLSPVIPPVHLLPPPVTIGPETITLLASCSVGIHLSICWVVSVSWDGSWQFSQSITTPQLSIG